MIGIAPTRAAIAGGIALLLGGCAEETRPTAPTASTIAAPSPSDVDKLALLIGIGDYPEHTHGSFVPLRGTANDVALVRGLLVHRFGFPETSIRVVRDRDATLEGIVRAFDEHLLQQARPDTEVFVYFSGHGSQVEDKSGRERQRRDSTLVAWDSRIDGRRGQYDLSDDCLYSLLSALTTRNRARVTIVTDCCHSGDTVRGGRLGAARSLPAGNAPVDSVAGWTFWPNGVPFQDDDRRPGMRGLARCVHLAACASDETAFEYDFAADGEPRRVHGIMTWWLVDTMRRAEPGDSFRTIARRTAASMRAMRDVPRQSLWIDGSPADVDRAVFGSGFSPAVRGFDVRILGATTLKVGAGWLHGLGDGAALDLFDDNETPVGQARVVQAELGTSRAAWIGTPPGDAGTRVLLGRLRSRPQHVAPLDVATDDPDLVAACANSSWARVHEGGTAPAGYVLARLPEGGISLSTADGIPLWSGREAGSELDAAFRDEFDFQRLWNLSLGAAGPLADVALSFEPMTADDAREPGEDGGYVPAPIEPRAAGSGGSAALPEWHVPAPTFAAQDTASRHEVVRLVLENRTRERVFVQVLSLTEDRKRNRIWPEEGRNPAECPLAGDADRVEITVLVDRPEATDWPLSRPMRDRYVAVVTRQPIDLDSFLRPTRGGDASFGAVSVDLVVAPR